MNRYRFISTYIRPHIFFDGDWWIAKDKHRNKVQIKRTTVKGHIHYWHERLAQPGLILVKSPESFLEIYEPV